MNRTFIMDDLAKELRNANLYDDNYSFVFKYGEDLINLLSPKKGERILDLGCGTGHLTDLIAKSGAEVTGIDKSPEMIYEAKNHYPNIKFGVEDACDFNFSNQFDAVFSNAVLHWIKDPEKVLICIYDSLKKGGRFVGEFGGKNNINRVETALRKELLNAGYKTNSEYDIWYYPSVAEFASLLEEIGFTVSSMIYFKRDTFLKENDDISGWIEMFGKSFFHDVDREHKKQILERIQNSLKETNFSDGKWFIDYIRLRFIALKA